MKRQKLEFNVLQIAENVRNKQAVETSLVELKAEWPDPASFTRQLAGMCNAARGEPAMLIIGLDEDKGVVGAPIKEIASWYSQIEPWFDGHCTPRLIDHIAIDSDGKTLHALLFETDRAPYTVHVGDREGNRTDRLEVPYRCATRTRSARREDLLRILMPTVTVPLLDVLSCAVEDRIHKPEKEARVTLQVYCTPRSAEIVALPCHKLQAELYSGNSPLDSHTRGIELRKYSQPLSGTLTEVFVSAPCRVFVTINFFGPYLTLDGVQQLKLVLRWTPGGGDTPAVAEAILRRVGQAEWNLQP